MVCSLDYPLASRTNFHCHRSCSCGWGAWFAIYRARFGILCLSIVTLSDWTLAISTVPMVRDWSLMYSSFVMVSAVIFKVGQYGGLF